MPKTKQQPVKRKYTKKNKTLKQVHLNPVQLLPPQPIPEQRDMEIAELTQVISIFSNWSDDQKTRNIRFLASKYWEYLKDSTML